MVNKIVSLNTHPSLNNQNQLQIFTYKNICQYRLNIYSTQPEYQQLFRKKTKLENSLTQLRSTSRFIANLSSLPHSLVGNLFCCDSSSRSTPHTSSPFLSVLLLYFLSPTVTRIFPLYLPACYSPLYCPRVILLSFLVVVPLNIHDLQEYEEATPNPLHFGNDLVSNKLRSNHLDCS